MHLNALTKASAALFSRCHRFSDFYLVGGTALALQIGHRLSVDFDFFSPEKLSTNLLIKVKRVFAGYTIQLTYRSPEQINLLIGGVKFTFFYYPYPLLYTLVTYKKVALASIQEIALMKALAVGRRLAYKDYVDWYFLLHEHEVKLHTVINGAQKKFNGDFNDRLFLSQLVSLEDIATQKIDFLRKPISRTEVEHFLIKVAKRVLP